MANAQNINLNNVTDIRGDDITSGDIINIHCNENKTDDKNIE